jgi:hypothetical protein
MGDTFKKQGHGTERTHRISRAVATQIVIASVAVAMQCGSGHVKARSRICENDAMEI